MKKLSMILLIGIILALLVVSTAFAGPGKAPVKGEVKEVFSDTMTVVLETKDGNLITVILPESVDVNLIEVGQILLVKGEFQEDGTLLAERVMWADDDGDDDGETDPGDDDGDGGKLTSAYCEPGQKENYHPFATKMNERFGVPEGWVMEQFCDGMGMGAIMLALMTEQTTGTSAGDLLEARKGGQGWGQIWKLNGVINFQKDGESPPGLLHRPEHAGPKDKDK